MIGDSIPWKEDLIRVAASLERRETQSRWLERTSFSVERDIMTSAYAVRKLSEARKISDELRAEGVPARRHRLTGKPVDVWNRHEFWEHYDLADGQEVTLSLGEFCNQIIHSWIWMLSATEDKPPRFDGIFVSSDWERKKYAYFIRVTTLVQVFRSVGLDDVLAMDLRRDEHGVMHITRASRNPEP